MTNSPDTSGNPGDPARSPDDAEDDVQGHRMFTPDQAQERSDAARIRREQRLDEEPAAPVT